MGLSPSLIGTAREGASLLVTRSRLRLFAKSTGQQDPIFIDVDAARRASHSDLPVPPTFFFAVGLELPAPLDFLTDLGVDLAALLHGEQEFTYHRTAHAGDTLTSSPVITDVFEKKGGALMFLVTEAPVVDQDDVLVATMRETLVVRQLAGAGA
ncbi:MaoC family dehydratase N-terminal domain-containing protein [Qaidamihabitans albus]|uniref:MaoC family dehydratase N-terminal domain-containing protein n=1 Tax=Qaidamihabitans albus TaxID=2795733 RepID=UPI0018F273FF|nr:MaoC family dehydratase N-terminal domain-containing protein [Qaidamihabitans albus]